MAHIQIFTDLTLADHIPLKQGLRLVLACIDGETHTLADHIPLKQGLRQGYSEEEVGSYRSRRPYSIKTRIKTLSHFTAEGKSSLADHIPLKQGLRPGEGGLVRPIRPIPKTSRHLIPILEFSNTDIRDH